MSYFRKYDTTHDGLYSGRPGQYTSPAESNTSSRKPSGKNKVYFRYNLSAASRVTVECDLSPNFKIDEQFKLTSGHIRLRCPMPDCPGWMHVWADHKSVFCHPTGMGSKHVFDTSDGFDGTYLLPILTILEPVKCNYRERTDGAKAGCRWSVKIAEGTAYDHVEMPKGYSKSKGGILVKVI